MHDQALKFRNEENINTVYLISARDPNTSIERNDLNEKKRSTHNANELVENINDRISALEPCSPEEKHIPEASDGTTKDRTSDISKTLGR